MSSQSRNASDQEHLERILKEAKERSRRQEPVSGTRGELEAKFNEFWKPVMEVEDTDSKTGTRSYTFPRESGNLQAREIARFSAYALAVGWKISTQTQTPDGSMVFTLQKSEEKKETSF